MAIIMLAHFDEYRCNKYDFILISPDINMGISFLFSLILFYLYRVDAVWANCVSNFPCICTWFASMGVDISVLYYMFLSVLSGEHGPS